MGSTRLDRQDLALAPSAVADVGGDTREAGDVENNAVATRRTAR